MPDLLIVDFRFGFDFCGDVVRCDGQNNDDDDDGDYGGGEVDGGKDEDDEAVDDM